MTKLLSGSSFDSFLLEEASLSMQVTWLLDGKINRGFYSAEEWEDESLHPYPLISWSEVRGHLRDLIRGKKAPVSFQFVLHLKPELMEKMLRKGGEDELLSSVGAFVLTIRYKDGEVSLLSGISMKSFTMNKNADRLWDKTVRLFLESKEIAFEPLG